MLKVRSTHAGLMKARRRLTRDGIQFDGLWYNDRIVAEIRSELHDPSVLVALDANDIGSISMIDPRTDRWIDVPAVDQEYAAGRTRSQNKLVQRELALRSRREGNVLFLKDVFTPRGGGAV
jgi:putative transposase